MIVRQFHRAGTRETYAPLARGSAGELLAARARDNGSQIAFTELVETGSGERSVTYAQLYDRARAIAGSLAASSLAQQRVLVGCSSPIDFLAAIFGCCCAGAIAVPVESPVRRRRLSRLKQIAADCQARAIITSPIPPSKFCQEARSDFVRDGIDWLVVDDCLNIGSTPADSSWADPDAIAYLQYTSGSTGAPRGVAISHRALLSNLDVIHYGVRQSPESTMVQWLPLHHDMGLVNAIYAMYVGFPCVLYSPGQFAQRPLSWIEAVSRYRATYSGGPNFAYDLCVDYGRTADLSRFDLSSWQVAFCGAEFVRADTLERFTNCFARAGFRESALYPCYGQAEFTVAISGGNFDQPPIVRHVLPDSLSAGVVQYAEPNHATTTVVGCGHTAPDHTVRIVDPERRHPLADRQVGEIWASGPSRGSGYWQREKETAQRFHAVLSTGQGPFLRTGDLGFVDDGELFVTGRAGDLIKLRGCKCYPDDIERVVEQAHPALRAGRCAAFSTGHQSDEGLVVVVEVDRSQLQQLAADEIRTAIERRLVSCREIAPWAVLVVRPAAIPRASNGKLQRGECRRQYLAGDLRDCGDLGPLPGGRAK